MIFADIDTLRIVLFLLAAGESPPLDWLARLIYVQLLEVDPHTGKQFVASERGRRYLT